ATSVQCVVSTVDQLSSDAPELSSDQYPLPFRRWLFLAALLVGEIFWISLRFDSASLAVVHAGWATLLGKASLFVQAAIAILAAMLLFGGAKLNRTLLQFGRSSLLGPFSWMMLLVHFLFLFVFYRLSVILFDGSIQNYTEPIVWFGLWLVAGI